VHAPFVNRYRSQFYFRTTDVTGVAKLSEGTEMVMPRDNATMEIELITPIAMENGLRFAIREGGHAVKMRPVTEIIRQASDYYNLFSLLWIAIFPFPFQFQRFFWSCGCAKLVIICYNAFSVVAVNEGSPWRWLSSD